MPSLFIEPTLGFEKTAAEVSLPEDPNGWPEAIVQELFKSAVFASDFDPHLVMDRADAERGYALGRLELHATTPEEELPPARVPVVVRDRKLQPLDLLVTKEGGIVPLTERRLRAALF